MKVNTTFSRSFAILEPRLRLGFCMLLLVTVTLYRVYLSLNEALERCRTTLTETANENHSILIRFGRPASDLVSMCFEFKRNPMYISFHATF